MEPLTILACDRHRQVVDAQGEPWFVFEHTPDYDRRAGPTLVFMSELIVRRVRSFPADWLDLTDAALLEASWGR